jgi:general secretion pathway protein K
MRARLADILRRRPPRSRQRGAALLIVITSIAILTAVTVDLAYNTRVSLQAAANARDELRAYYLAKSAVAMGRMVLYFQQRLDGTTSGAGGAAGAAGAAGAPKLGIRLWDLIPVDSSAASLFLGGGGARSDVAAAPARTPAVLPAAASSAGDAAPEQEGGASGQEVGARRPFGDVEGSFHATLEDEERKINVRQFAGLASSGLLPAQAARLAELVKDPRWDFLFDEDDANGIRTSRRDLFAALKDWVDEDEVSSNFTGDPAKPFESGFGDENAVYDRMPDRYKAKNASFDSLDELYMVQGVSDAFMAAFGDKLTVYPDINAKINVNTDDPAQLMVNALLMADPPGQPQPALVDPAFLQKLRAALELAKPLPFMSITPKDFATTLQALGVKVAQPYLTGLGTANAFTDRSSTFRIRAVGVAGDVTKRIDAVVTFDPKIAEGLAQDSGRLLHWHEE